LDQATIDQLNIIASSEGEYAAGLAKNILSLYERAFAPVVCLHQEAKNYDGKPSGKLVESSKKANLMVFPNPSKERVIFQFHSFENSDILANINITTPTGASVLQKQIDLNNTSEFAWNASALPRGLYYYQLNWKDYVFSGKIILQ